jgi:hypothetical protein
MSRSISGGIFMARPPFARARWWHASHRTRRARFEGGMVRRCEPRKSSVFCARHLRTRSAGDRVKTGRGDSRKLARFYPSADPSHFAS